MHTMIHEKLRSTLILLSGLCMTFAPGATNAITIESTLERPALMLRDIQHVALLGIANAGNRLVTVGERGVIGVSDDNGKSWRQVKSPVSVTLTAVRFVDERRGWAIGHRGVVLHSADGGETWIRQLDGTAIAALMLKFADELDAQAGTHDEVRRGAATAARQIAKDGADKPLFDLYFRDQKNGFVVGAYGLALATMDGGQSWHPAMDRFANPKGLHLYAIQGVGDLVYIVGEQGMLVRSRNQGGSFERIQTPYRGSFFALSATSSGQLVAAGLNGNAYASTDMGNRWNTVGIPNGASFSAFLRLADGTLLLTDQTGRVFSSRNLDQPFRLASSRASTPLSGVTRAANGRLVGVGLMGVVHITADAIAEQK